MDTGFIHDTSDLKVGDKVGALIGGFAQKVVLAEVTRVSDKGNVWVRDESGVHDNALKSFFGKRGSQKNGGWHHNFLMTRAGAEKRLLEEQREEAEKQAYSKLRAETARALEVAKSGAWEQAGHMLIAAGGIAHSMVLPNARKFLGARAGVVPADAALGGPL